MPCIAEAFQRNITPIDEKWPHCDTITDAMCAECFAPLASFAADKSVLKPGSKSEDLLQKKWNEVLAKARLAATRVELLDRHGKASLNDHTHLYPDLVAYTRARSGQMIPFFIEFVGDIKDKDEKPFLAKHYTQIRRYAHTIFSEQRLRTFVCCFLATDKFIEFFRFERAPVGQELPFYRLATLPIIGAGGKLLLTLLNASADELGSCVLEPFKLATGEMVFPCGHLGRGRSAYAFAARMQEKKVVVKRFKPDQLLCLRTEADTLRLLAPQLAEGSCIPSVIAVIEPNLLVLSPLARKFAYHPQPRQPILIRSFLSLARVASPPPPL